MRAPTLTSEQMAIGLLFVLLAALACLAPAQSDTWWLLRAGQQIWQTGNVPMADTWSHTAAGLYWPNHEWLTEAVFYALHRVGGMPLVALACAATMTGAWALAYSMTRGPFEARLLLLIASVIAAAGAFALRPQVFTMAAFAATAWLLVRDRLIWVPLVVLVWANFHGAAALGIVATGAVTGLTLVAERRVPWRLVATSGAVVIATALTPMGTGLWRFWIESPQRSDVNQLIEWLPPDFSPYLWPFWAVAAALPVLTLLRWRQIDRQTLRLAAIALGVLPLAFQAIRNVHVFMLVALPAMTSLIAAGRAARPSRATRENLRLNGALTTGAATVAAVFVALVWARPPDMLGWSPVSDEAARAVRACGDPLFNTYGTGGELIWFVPGKRVFIDNRQDPYPMDLLQANRAAELGGEYAALFERYDIRCAALPPDSLIADGLARDPGWTRPFADAQWVVFTRDPAGR